MNFHHLVALFCMTFMTTSNSVGMFNIFTLGRAAHRTEKTKLVITPEQRKRIEAEIQSVDTRLLISKCAATLTCVGVAAASVGLVIYGQGLYVQGFAPDPVPKGVDPRTLEPDYQYLYSTLLCGSIVGLSIPVLNDMHEEINALEKHKIRLKQRLAPQSSQ